MTIDPSGADKFFAQQITVGAGIDGIQEKLLEIRDSVFANEPILEVLDSPQAQAAGRRVDIALAHLAKDKKSYSSFEDKFAQAKKVAKNIEIYSALKTSDKSKSLIELGFTAESINKILNYAYQSLGLNYRSSLDFEEMAKKPVADLSDTLEAFVTRNFLKQMFTDEFFPVNEKMDYLSITSEDGELSFVNQEHSSPMPLMSEGAFKRKITDNFALDDFRIKDLFSGESDSMSFFDLADELQDRHLIKVQDYSL